MIETLLADLASLGFLLNNCYQHDDGTWRVNLRRPDPNSPGDHFTAWAIAPTFLEALEDSMINLIDAEYFPTPAVTSSLAPAEPKLTLAQRLGIGVKVERRI